MFRDAEYRRSNGYLDPNREEEASVTWYRIGFEQASGRETSSLKRAEERQISFESFQSRSFRFSRLFGARINRFDRASLERRPTLQFDDLNRVARIREIIYLEITQLSKQS